MDPAVIGYVVVIGTAIWVAVDAGNLGARSGRLGGGFFDMGPVGWFFATVLLWIIAFPAYLVKRPEYLALRAELEPATPTPTPTSTARQGAASPTGFCPKCGGARGADDEFCRGCGHPLAAG